MMRYSRRVLLMVLLLLVSACGGGDSDDGNGTDAPATTAASSGGSGDSGDGGEIVLGGEIPDFFPSDLYLPDGINVRGVTENPANNTISLSGVFESGDPAAIQADVVAGLKAAGYEFLTDEEGIAVFVKNGVGRVRVRTRDFLDQLTLTVDIDTWTDEQLDELRALFVEEVTVTGSATATFGGESLSADGECILAGDSRMFFADDISITIQIDETRDPVYVYADVTTPEGIVWTLDESVTPSYESSPQRMTASGEMYDYTGDAANVDFTIEATCDA